MVTVNIDLPDDLRALAEERAKAQGVSLADFVRSCVSERVTLPHDQQGAGLEDDVLLEADEAHIEYMRQGLKLAEAQAAAGKVVPWDKDGFLREARERLRQNGS